MVTDATCLGAALLGWMWPVQRSGPVTAPAGGQVVSLLGWAVGLGRGALPLRGRAALADACGARGKRPGSGRAGGTAQTAG